MPMTSAQLLCCVMPERPPRRDEAEVSRSRRWPTARARAARRDRRGTVRDSDPRALRQRERGGAPPARAASRAAAPAGGAAESASGMDWTDERQRPRRDQRPRLASRRAPGSCWDVHAETAAGMSAMAAMTQQDGAAIAAHNAAEVMWGTTRMATRAAATTVPARPSGAHGDLDGAGRGTGPGPGPWLLARGSRRRSRSACRPGRRADEQEGCAAAALSRTACSRPWHRRGRGREAARR